MNGNGLILSSIICFMKANAKDPMGVDSSGKPYKVLLVDDSMFIRKQLSQILNSEGFDVVGQAEDGLQGLAACRADAPKISHELFLAVA